MQAKAQLKHLRIAPRKIRLAADMIRGKTAGQAKTLLSFSVQKWALVLKKLLDSAIANAKNNLDLKEESLYIAKITVDEGPKLKRRRARSRGRAYPIQKKTSHITLILEGEKESSKKSAPGRSEASIGTASLEAKASNDNVVDNREEKTKPKTAKPKRQRGVWVKEKAKKKGGFSKIFRRKSF